MSRASAASGVGGYSLTARVFHWLIAALVLTMVVLGLVMTNFDLGPVGDTFYDLHRSVGALVLPLMMARLIWRLRHPAPPLPADIPAIQQLAAHLTHWALYGLVIGQAILGWFANSAYGAPFRVFWLFTLPSIWPHNEPLSDRLFALHRLIGIAIAVLLCAHSGAALFHHFVRKDNVLMRMVSG